MRHGDYKAWSHQGPFGQCSNYCANNQEDNYMVSAPSDFNKLEITPCVVNIDNKARSQYVEVVNSSETDVIVNKGKKPRQHPNGRPVVGHRGPMGAKVVGHRGLQRVGHHGRVQRLVRGPPWASPHWWQSMGKAWASPHFATREPPPSHQMQHVLNGSYFKKRTVKI